MSSLSAAPSEHSLCFADPRLQWPLLATLLAPSQATSNPVFSLDEGMRGCQAQETGMVHLAAPSSPRSIYSLEPGAAGAPGTGQMRLAPVGVHQGILVLPFSTPIASGPTPCFPKSLKTSTVRRFNKCMSQSILGSMYSKSYDDRIPGLFNEDSQL